MAELTKDQEARCLAALERLARDPQPFQLKVSKFEMWMLLAAIQLAWRDPRFKGPVREKVETAARLIGRELTRDDPDLALLFAAGWDREFNMT